MKRIIASWTAALVVVFIGPAAAREISATLRPSFSSFKVEIGSHVTFWIAFTEEDREGAKLPEVLNLGPEWSVVSGPRSLKDRDYPDGERPYLGAEWTLMPLAGGTLFTPEIAVAQGDGSTLLIPAASILVREALGETEDAPRPLLGFREVADRRIGDARTAIFAAGGALGLLLLVGLMLRARRRSRQSAPASVRGASPREEILALRESAALAHSPAAVMESLGPLFRRAMDEPLGESVRLRRAALTDEAWAAELGSPEGTRLMEELSSVRYGGGSPTSFAVKDALDRVTSLLSTKVDPAEDIR